MIYLIAMDEDPITEYGYFDSKYAAWDFIFDNVYPDALNDFMVLEVDAHA